MTIRKALPQFAQISFLIVIFISPLLVGEGFAPVAQNQSVAADVPGPSVILMIGDGMGYEQVELARLVEVGYTGSLTMQQLTWNASMATFNILGEITDSAAAGTAMATGNKTTNGRLGMLPNDVIVENIIEISQGLGKATGLVSTCRMVDATPAAFATHVATRSDYSLIASQLMSGYDIDVLLAGGDNYFSTSQENSMASHGYTVVKNRDDMLNVTSGKIFGLFAPEHIDYEIDRDYNATPSIAEMTNKSLGLLSQDSDGFFLMVEGGKIDLACHAENQVNAALEAIEFDKAVKVALDYVETNTNTILIVTADHETEGLVVVSSDLNDTLPSAALSQAENEAIRIARANNVTVEWTASYHTMTPVPVYCYGSAFSSLPEDVTFDNTHLFTMMKNYLLGLSVDVPDTLAPTWSITPSDQEITVGEAFSYQVQAVDASGIDSYHVNDTVNFAISPTGLVTNLTSLIIGTYGLNVSASDPSSNTIFREITITVVAEPPPTTTATTTTSMTTTTGSTSETTTSPTTTTTDTGTGIPIDTSLYLMIGIGGVVIVLVVVLLIRKR